MQRRLLKYLSVGASVLLLALLVALGLGAFSIAFPNPQKVRLDYGQVEDFFAGAQRLEGPEGVSGLLLPNPASRAVVVMCHGRSRQKEQLLPLAVVLARNWNVFVFDFRSHGQRGYGPTSIGWHEADDLAAVLDFLEPRFPEGLMVFGESMGAAAAVYELARHPRRAVKALVADGCYDDLEALVLAEGDRLGFPRLLTQASLTLAGLVADFTPHNLRPLDHAPNLKLPVLFLQAQTDQLVPPGAAQRLAQAAGPNAQTATYPGGHDEPANPALQKLVSDYLKGLQPTAQGPDDPAAQ